RRYATANDLALDLQRFLDNEPVQARPPSNLYRLQKLVRRHRGAFAAAAAVIIALTAGAGLSLWQALRATRAEHAALQAQQREVALRHQAEHERERAERERASARLNEYVADINLAQQSWTAGNLGRALQLLDKHRPKTGEPDLRGFEWRYLWQLCQGDPHTTLPDQGEAVQSLAYSPDGRLLAVGLWEKLSVWNLQTRTCIATLPKGGLSLAFTPDGRSLISASASTVRVWDTSDWSERLALPENSGPISLSANGTRLATVTRNGVRVWDTANWREVHFAPEAFAPIALSADGRLLATDTRAGLTIWPLGHASAPRVMEDSTNLFGRLGRFFRNDRAVVFSPDGRHLLAPRNSLSERGVFVVSVWDTTTGREAVMPDDPEHVEHTGAISAIVFSPTDPILATASRDHSIRLWDFERRQRIAIRQGHLSEVWTLALSPDGQQIASGAKDGSVKLWPTREPAKTDLIPGKWQLVAFSTDNKTVAALTPDRFLVFLNVLTGEVEHQFAPPGAPERGRPRFGPPPVALTADFRQLVQGAERGSIQIIDTATRETAVLNSPDGRVDALALSGDGHLLVTAARERPIRLWNLQTRTNAVIEAEAQRLLLSPDGRTLATFARRDSVQLWDVATLTLRTNLAVELPPGFAVFPGATFSPDGRLLAMLTEDDTIDLWDTGTGALFGTCVGHKQGVFSAAFSPDGKTLATASDDSTIKLWNVATQQELLTIRRLGGSMRELLFAPDGSMLVGVRGLMSRTGGLRFYRAPLFSQTDPPPPGRPRAEAGR
ncbi:MAG TPA: WD40 repeat domain-containing protein, partial [Methylomirabilota bacterium]|nr:WD40 repeat domain-containing protein [Methylomirabilota bacterium]